MVVLLSITGGEKEIRICSSCLNRGLVLGNKAVVGSVSSHMRDFQKGIKDLLSIRERWPGLLEKLITARHTPEHVQEALSTLGNEIKSVIGFPGCRSK